MHVDDGPDAMELDSVAAEQRVAWRPSGRQRDAHPHHGAELQPSDLPHRQAELLLPHCEYLLTSPSSLLTSQFV